MATVSVASPPAPVLPEWARREKGVVEGKAHVAKKIKKLLAFFKEFSPGAAEDMEDSLLDELEGFFFDLTEEIAEGVAKRLPEGYEFFEKEGVWGVWKDDAPEDERYER
jgi:hypothetical protein